MVFEGRSEQLLPNDILNAMAAQQHGEKFELFLGLERRASNDHGQYFQEHGRAGTIFFNASGDSDAFTTGANSVNGVDNTSLHNAPSSSPYITQVGGTTLTMTGTGGAYASETVWNWGYDRTAVMSAAAAASAAIIPFRAGRRMSTYGGQRRFDQSCAIFPTWP